MTESHDPNTAVSALSSNTGPDECVVCQVALVVERHESQHILVCPQAHGIFLDSDALQGAVRDRGADRSDVEEQAAMQAQSSHAADVMDAAEAPHACPVCGNQMSKQVYAYESGVVIDVCADHGIWLDSGELQRIEAWYEGQERHLDGDREIWGGQSGKLEQIEAEHERAAADEHRAVHWGPVGRFMSSASHWWQRRDDR